MATDSILCKKDFEEMLRTAKLQRKEAELQLIVAKLIHQEAEDRIKRMEDDEPKAIVEEMIRG